MRYIIITNCNTGFQFIQNISTSRVHQDHFPVINDLHVITRNASFASNRFTYIYPTLSQEQNAIIWREKSVKYSPVMYATPIIYGIIAMVVLFHSRDAVAARSLVDCVARISRYVESLL